MSLEFEVSKDGMYQPQIVLTKARDYAIVQLMIDDVPLGDPIDAYNTPDVITTGLLKLPTKSLTQGKHVLKVKIIGKHPDAVPGYMVGIDFIRLIPTEN